MMRAKITSRCGEVEMRLIAPAKPIFLGVLCLFAVTLVRAQYENEKDRWLRVSTGSDVLVEIDKFSLDLEPDNKITALFRQVPVDPEREKIATEKDANVRYDRIRFDLRNNRYEVVESRFVDASGKVTAFSTSEATAEWKPLWGKTGRTFLAAAAQLRPFGWWRIVSQKYASGELLSKDDLVGITTFDHPRVSFSPGSLQVGSDRCSDPIFDPKTVTDEEFTKLVGSSMKLLGIDADRILIVRMVCTLQDKRSMPTAFLITPDGKGLLLWDGVFLEIEREKNYFSP